MHTYVIPELKEAWDKVLDDARKVGIGWDDITSVSFDNAQKRLGCCHRKEGVYSITISKYLKKENWANVLMHELCHAKDGVAGHGKKWQIRAKKANSIGYNISVTGSYEELDQQPQYKYKIFCEQCGASCMRIRETHMVKHPGAYFCGKCGGSLIVKHLV